MNEATQQPAAPIMPPPDVDGEHQAAGSALRKCRKEILDLPIRWKRWVISSLSAGIDAQEKAESEEVASQT